METTKEKRARLRQLLLQALAEMTDLYREELEELKFAIADEYALQEHKSMTECGV